MKARLDNLSAQNQRLMREITQLSLRIELEEQRFHLPEVDLIDDQRISA